MVDEVEQLVVGPVEVLEHEDERTLVGHRLEEAPPGGKRLAATIRRGVVATADADESAKVRLDPACLASFSDRVLDRSAQLPLCLFRRVAFQDPRLRLDDLR